jgi:hypothetical protein
VPVSASQISVPDLAAETGSMTGGWVASLCPTTSTKQSQGSNSSKPTCTFCAEMGACESPDLLGKRAAFARLALYDRALAAGYQLPCPAMPNGVSASST